MKTQQTETVCFRNMEMQIWILTNEIITLFWEYKLNSRKENQRNGAVSLLMAFKLVFNTSFPAIYLLFDHSILHSDSIT